LVFAPYKSLAELDEQAVNMRELLGNDFDKFVDFANKASATTEDTLFSIDNKMTLPAGKWVAADPAFWAPKATVAKGAVKKEAVVPAVNKEVPKK
jgi:hypothetical protein